MKLPKFLFSTLLCGALAHAGLFFGSAKSADASEWVDIEHFTLAGFVAGEVAQLVEHVVALGAAQASFQGQLDTARAALKEGWNNPAERDRAARQLAGLLFQKDIMYALIPLSEGVSNGWKRSEAFNRLSGTPLDAGISQYAVSAFLHWVQTVRAQLDVYEEDLLSPLVSVNWALISSAIERSDSAYRRYGLIRDAEELSRFLSLPSPRLADDGSALLKDQIIEGFSAVGWGVNQRHTLGAELRALARRKQPMLECVYGPITVGSKEQSRSVYPVRMFWYKSSPANIQDLIAMDNHPTLTGVLGGFAQLGSGALEQCPESENQASDLHAGNVAMHPATLAQHAKKEALQERIAKKCGNDAACARQEMRLAR